MNKIKQLSIFIENQTGALYNALNVLAEGGINIRALSLADTSEFAILRLVVQDPIKGKELLESKDFIVKDVPLLAIELNDVPGGLASILKVLDDENIDLEYIYAFTHEKTSKAILLLHTSDLDQLEEVFTENNIALVQPSEVYNLE
ncbi:MAG: acetolactate synthase [Methanobacteriaceae archaeon]|nr:acetolactate synthase [Methanobacteriaceae archaeon]